MAEGQSVAVSLARLVLIGPGTWAVCCARGRDLQPENKGAHAAGSRWQVCRCVGEGRKRLEACNRYLERREVAALHVI